MSIDRARDLETALTPYAHVDGLLAHVRDALGADPAASLDGQVLVRAYTIRTSDTVFSVYALTGDGFVVAELSRDGQTFAVFVDPLRIARVAAGATSEGYTLLVEIDADVRQIRFEHDERGGPVAGEDGYLARGSARGSVLPASYEIRGAVDDIELRWLARQLRRPGG